VGVLRTGSAAQQKGLTAIYASMRSVAEHSAVPSARPRSQEGNGHSALANRPVVGNGAPTKVRRRYRTCKRLTRMAWAT